MLNVIVLMSVAPRYNRTRTCAVEVVDWFPRANTRMIGVTTSDQWDGARIRLHDLRERDTIDGEVQRSVARRVVHGDVRRGARCQRDRRDAKFGIYVVVATVMLLTVTVYWPARTPISSLVPPTT